MRALKERHPDHRFSLVIGADLVAERERWHGWAELKELVPFIVVGREGAPTTGGIALPAVSSTIVRERLGARRAGRRARRRRRGSTTSARAGSTGDGVVSEISKTQRLPMRPRSRERLLIVGDGPVARALAAALQAADAAPLRWWRGARTPLPAADVVVLAVRDEAIGEVAAQIMAGVDDEATPPILLHCAGALPAEEAFAGAQAAAARRRRVASAARARRRRRATRSSAASCSPSRATVRGARRRCAWSSAWAARRWCSRPAQLPRYHAAAALVSNHAVGARRRRRRAA